MRFPYQHPLFDPEAPESPAGGGDPAPDASSTPAPEATPAPEGDPKPAAGGADATPAYITALADRLGQIESGMAANTAVNAALAKHGINDAAALDTQLDLITRINQNPAMKQVMDSLAAPDPQVDSTRGSPQPAATPTDLSKMSTGDVQALIDQTVLQSLTRFQQTQNQQQFNDATAVEARFIGELLKAPAYKSIVGEHNFDALMAGKGSAAGNALAIITDQLMYERGVKDPQTGQMRPVTDPTVVAEVGKQLQGMMAELQAAAILSASQDPNAIESPDAPLLDDSNIVNDDPSEGDAYTGDPDPKAIREHFRKTEQQTLAVLEGSPAAAILGG